MKKLWKWLIALVLILVFLFVENEILQVSKYTYASPEITEDLVGISIVQLSDLHQKEFRFSNLINKVKKEDPQLIFITGDIIDRRDTSLDVALDMVSDLVSIAPVYFINGNHENDNDLRGELHRNLRELGVTVLVNENATFEKNGSKINIIGIDDATTFIWGYGKEEGIKKMQETVESLMTDGFNILLSHHPEYLPELSETGVDLIFSGHAHGGQVRIPFIGGIYTNGQGFFPKYTAGVKVEGSTAEVISRGLGNSGFPIRMFNRPEIVSVKLQLPED